MRRLVAVLLVGVLALSSCGGDDPSGDPAGGGDHNAADVEFATSMIPHHAQALHMVDMAEAMLEGTSGGRTTPEFRRLLADIEAAQGPEIEQMAGWLEQWGEDVPATDVPMGGDGMDHGAGHGMGDGMDDGMGGGDDGAAMPGMMGARELDRLAMMRGEAFERMWMRMMIEHHEGAIEMAETEQAEGEHPGALALADDIVTAQRAEIALMEDLLRR